MNPYMDPYTSIDNFITDHNPTGAYAYIDLFLITFGTWVLVNVLMTVYAWAYLHRTGRWWSRTSTKARRIKLIKELLGFYRATLGGIFWLYLTEIAIYGLLNYPTLRWPI
jgi:hypothetical protein